jgi:uncharacterized protein YraI
MTSRIALVLAFVCLAPASVLASALFGFTVANVPDGDVLNVRAGPGTAHAIQAAYPNGTQLSLTGTCVGLHLNDLGNLSRAEKYARTRTRWCEIWHDPQNNGTFATGWVHGRYVTPH